MSREQKGSLNKSLILVRLSSSLHSVGDFDLRLPQDERETEKKESERGGGREGGREGGWTEISHFSRGGERERERIYSFLPSFLPSFYTSVLILLSVCPLQPGDPVFLGSKVFLQK